MKWTDVPVHVIDFEGCARTGVVEYGVATLRGGAIVGIASRGCRPSARIRADETQVHGLADADLADAAPFADEWERFAELRATGLLAAHFSGTENMLLRVVWPYPRLSPDFLNPEVRVAEWGPWIDTGRIAAEARGANAPWLRAPASGESGSASEPLAHARGYAASAKLEDLVAALQLDALLASLAAQHCSPERRRFHCALFDALACALVLNVLARDASGEPWSLARVLTASTADARRRDDRQQARLF